VLVIDCALFVLYLELFSQTYKIFTIPILVRMVRGFEVRVSKAARGSYAASLDEDADIGRIQVR
jgi:hypothetical protein